MPLLYSTVSITQVLYAHSTVSITRRSSVPMA